LRHYIERFTPSAEEFLRKKELTPQELAGWFAEKFGERVRDIVAKEKPEGTKGALRRTIWMNADREILRDMIRSLIDEIHYPHLSVISGTDEGEKVELQYHIQVYYGERATETTISVRFALPKDDLWIDSICDLIPGALISEREKQEMLGVDVRNIYDSRRYFLPDDFPQGVYPWRKDETGIKPEMVRKLSEVGL